MKTLEDIIPKLVDKTKQGHLVWSQGISNEGYKTNFGKYRVDVWKWEQEDETEGVTVGLKIGDNSKEFIDTVYYDTYSSRFHIVEDLYLMARRSFNNVDKVIDDAEEELNRMFKF